MTKNNFFPIEEHASLIDAINLYDITPTTENTHVVKTILEAIYRHVEKIESRSDLISLFETNFKDIYMRLISSHIIDKINKTNIEITGNYNSNSKKQKIFMQEKNLLKSMLQVRAINNSLHIKIDQCPKWMLDIYLVYACHQKEIFTEIGESDSYFNFFLQIYTDLRNYIFANHESELIKKHSGIIERSLRLHTLYFNDNSMVEIAKRRSEILKKLLSINNYPLNFIFPKNKKSSKIKVGIYDAALADRTETYATLPFLQLDKKLFETIIITESSPAHQKLSDYCNSYADSSLILSKNLIESVNAIRKLNLDYIIIGSNISAVTNFAHLIFQHKVANKHIATFCNPITTGINETDYFLLGNHIKYDNIQSDFTEQIIFTNGAPGCLDMLGSLQNTSELNISKETYGIPEDSILFVSAAVCYKILPEIQDIWANLLSKTPGSYLLLHPFNPNWNSKYPEILFAENLSIFLNKYKIDANRIKIDRTNFKSRSDLKQLIKIGDIYLDTFPYSSFVSLTEVLECGVPPVVFKGKTMRGRQGSALLMDLDLENLIAENSYDYMNKILELYNDANHRKMCSNKIIDKMSRGPNFYNSSKYAKEVSEILYNIHKNSEDESRI